MSEIHKEPLIDLAGGRIRCRRCQAKSKRSVGSVMGVMPNRVVDVPLVAAQG